MRLLYTLTTYPPSTGGAQIHQHQIARHLQSRHTVQVAAQWDENRTDWLLGTTLFGPRGTRDYAVDGVPVHRLELSLLERLMLSPVVATYYPLMLLGRPPAGPIAARLERQLLRVGAGAQLIHNVRIGRAPLSLASLRLARRLGVPFVLTPVHHPRWVGPRYRAFQQVYAAADAVCTLTAAERDILIESGLQPDRVHVIGHGPVVSAQADADRFRQRYRIQGPIILFLGQHYRYKGYRAVLEAAARVWAVVPEARFVFIGPAVAESEAVFRACGDSRVHPLGVVDLQDKSDALAACSVLCVPSSQESFGGVYTEAWCFERPVIGCPIPAVSEVISDGVDGFLVPPEAGPIADRLVRLLADPDLARRMGAAGKAKVERCYTWDRIAANVEQVYRRLVPEAVG